jgi:membrane peptidoglycan carboxypeptidase
MQESTSVLMRKLMRLVVTVGTGTKAEVPGYYVGGKTGTAEKVGGHGYRKHTNVSAFMSVYPMNAPRYAVYMMLDEPHGDKSTAGYSTGGMVAAPAAGRVIARTAPMLGLLPDLQDAAAINQVLFIPMQPGRPPGAPTVASPGPAIAEVKPMAPPGGKPATALPARLRPPSGTAGGGTSTTPAARPDPRHEAELAPAVAGKNAGPSGAAHIANPATAAQVARSATVAQVARSATAGRVDLAPTARLLPVVVSMSPGAIPPTIVPPATMNAAAITLAATPSGAASSGASR